MNDPILPGGNEGSVLKNLPQIIQPPERQSIVKLRFCSSGFQSECSCTWWPTQSITPWFLGTLEIGGVIPLPSGPLLPAAGFLFLLLLVPKPAVFSGSKCGVCGKTIFLQEALPLPSPSWLPTHGSLSFHLPPHRLGFSLNPLPENENELPPGVPGLPHALMVMVLNATGF